VRRIKGGTLAEQFYFVLQRKEVEIDSKLISDRPEGQAVDELPDYRDELARIQTEEEEVTLLMQRVPGPEDTMIWKVSNVTVARIPELYDAFRLPDWVEEIRARVPQDRSFIGLELYKWVILLAAAAVLVPVGWVIGYLIARLISRPGAPLWKEIKGILTGPILGLAVLAFLGSLLIELGMGAKAYAIYKSHTMITFFTVWLIWDAVNIWRARRRHRYETEGRTDAAVLGRPIANAIKLVVVLIGLLVWLANAGVDITALLAGLGVGGIAVALALQKPIEDLFGAVSIYSQQPVSTGDLCRYGNEVGRVEEIGLRTTRIRTLANSVVSVPNAMFSTGVIENLAARTKIMYHPDLHLRPDTGREKIERVLQDLRQMLIDNPRIENETIRVRLAEFQPDAIVIRMRVFASTTDFEEYLAIVEEVNLDVMRILADNGARLSQRAQSLFIEESDGGFLQAGAKAAADPT
jgi:MscS family membrane protein